MSYQYDRYLAQHKSNVEAGFRWLQKNLPKITEASGAEINRYFKEGEKDFVEIDVAEYEIRQKMHEERLEKMKKDCNGCFGAANNDCLRCEEELQYESE